jgi:hypothetical protein
MEKEEQDFCTVVAEHLTIQQVQRLKFLYAQLVEDDFWYLRRQLSKISVNDFGMLL